MSETMTRITLPNQPERNWIGFRDLGAKTVEEMIESARQQAAYLRRQVDALDAATDSNFQIDVVKGFRVVRTLQQSDTV